MKCRNDSCCCCCSHDRGASLGWWTGPNQWTPIQDGNVPTLARLRSSQCRFCCVGLDVVEGTGRHVVFQTRPACVRDVSALDVSKSCSNCFPSFDFTFYVREATSNKCIASSNKCLTSSNKKLLVTSASPFMQAKGPEDSFLRKPARLPKGLILSWVWLPGSDLGTLPFSLAALEQRACGCWLQPPFCSTSGPPKKDPFLDLVRAGAVLNLTPQPL